MSGSLMKGAICVDDRRETLTKAVRRSPHTSLCMMGLEKTTVIPSGPVGSGTYLTAMKRERDGMRMCKVI